MDTDDRGSDLTRLSASCFLPLGGIEMQTGPQFQDRWKLKWAFSDWKGASDSCNVSNRWRDTMWNLGFGGDSKAWYEVRISRWGHSHSRSAFECAPGEAGHPKKRPRSSFATCAMEGCSAKRMLGMIDSVEVQGNQLIQQQHTYFSGLILLQS